MFGNRHNNGNHHLKRDQQENKKKYKSPYTNDTSLIIQKQIIRLKNAGIQLNVLSLC